MRAAGDVATATRVRSAHTMATAHAATAPMIIDQPRYGQWPPAAGPHDYWRFTNNPPSVIVKIVICLLVGTIVANGAEYLWNRK